MRKNILYGYKDDYHRYLHFSLLDSYFVFHASNYSHQLSEGLLSSLLLQRFTCD